MNKNLCTYVVLTAGILAACGGSKMAAIHPDAVKPSVVTEQVAYDTDDPAIWIHPEDSSKSLIIGTDKNSDGALFAFDLSGRIVKKSITLQRPNNVDIVQGFDLNGEKVDLAVTTERQTNKLRIFRLPELEPIDNGGILVFEGETERAPMGIALYTRPADRATFAIVGRKSGPTNGYLWQYELHPASDGKHITGTKVRQFGQYSGQKEIEAIAVDSELGYVYYSDEKVGVRKYMADPALQQDDELALFATKGFVSDHEGIAIYKSGPDTGYILVSNQQNNTVMVYPRLAEEGTTTAHPLLAEISISTVECDGLDISARNFGAQFPEGVLVAMSNGKSISLLRLARDCSTYSEAVIRCAGMSGLRRATDRYNRIVHVLGYVYGLIQKGDIIIYRRR